MTTQTTTRLSDINGLVFFNEDGSAGGYIRRGEHEFRVKGRIVAEGRVSVTDPDGQCALQYHRIDQTVERGPVGRGQLVVDGEVLSVSIFRVRTESGQWAHGLADSSLPARTDSPF